jgi:hypothetical protein
MTTLISWKANDSSGIASVYLASDSRFSWNSVKRWDYGQKIYGSRNFPEIVGYCGDVLFATSIINSLIFLIDKEIIYSNVLPSDEKNVIVFDYIKQKFDMFPDAMDTTIIHVIKDLNKKFSYYEIKYLAQKHSWVNRKVDLEQNCETRTIGVYGSGASHFTTKLNNYSKNDLNGTSRFCYMVFCDTLIEGKDKNTGGAPQLIGLYKGRNYSIDIGTIWNEKRYLYGMEVENEFYVENIEWRNQNFERYEAKTIKIINGAQRQPRPIEMKKPPW